MKKKWKRARKKKEEKEVGKGEQKQWKKNREKVEKEEGKKEKKIGLQFLTWCNI